MIEDPETDPTGVKWEDAWGRSSLHIAVTCGYADNVAELLRWDAPSASVDNKGQSPMLLAASMRRVDIL